MTVGVDDELRIREYPGDDSATPRAYGFKILDPDDLRVTRTNADGSETALVRGTHYSVSGAGNPTGGDVTPLAPIAAGTSWRIEGDMSLGQPTDYTAGDDFPAESHERGLDRSMIAHQEARRDINDTQARSLMFRRGEGPGVLPPKAELANKFIGGDAMGDLAYLRGTGNDPDFRDDAADPAIGPRLWGYRLPLTEALARHAQGKFDERISVFDFLPYAKHSQILDRTNNDDLGDLLLDGIFANPECRGARIFAPPGLYNTEQTLACDQHLTLYGAAGREMMDNSADAGGDTGTRFRYRGDSGHLMALIAPALDNHRTIVRLQDILLQHNRLLDDDTENPDQVDGCALYIAGGLGPTEGDRQLRFILDNVALYGGIDDNLLVEGNTYGSEIRYIHSMRAGRNGLRSLYGPSAGEMRIGMMRAFQNGYNGAADIDRAGVVLSSALVDIGQISSSEARGPGLMLGGIVNIGSAQCESCGLSVAAADRKQVIFGWLDHGLLSANIDNFLFDPGDAYQGAVVYHSRHASNVRLKGHFANALGVGGRHVELQAPDGPYSCGEIDVRETNASAFEDNGGGYNVKSGIEVRLRHGAQIALTGGSEIVAFQPAELYDPRGSWGAHKFTAPHNLILDMEMILSMNNVDKANHDRMRIYTILNGDTGSPYRIALDDPSSHVFAGSVLAVFPVALPTVPLDQGDTIEFRYQVTGGASNVGLVANESYLKLTALPK